MDFLFIIYSCKKNNEKSTLLYNLICDKLVNCKVLILNGDAGLKNEYEIVDDKYLLVKCGDNYEDLCQKTIQLMKTVATAFPNIKGLFKCNDGIVPNVIHINQFISCINADDTIQYSGNIVSKNTDELSTWHYNKCSDIKYNSPKVVHACKYAAGPFYYVSKQSIDCLKGVDDYDTYFYEDNMVGHILNNHNVYGHYYKSYYDDMEYLTHTIQNRNNAKFLFIRLEHGLGNQLFMVSSAYEMARNNNMILVLSYNHENNKAFMTHSTAQELMTTIFSKFLYTRFENIDVSKLVCYNEPRCFDYNSSIVRMKHRNYLIQGYFQNKKYITNESDVVSLFKNDELCSKLLYEYPLLYRSYFIHIRRGDYINAPHYAFDKDTYYKTAIDYILEKEKDKDTHFFIMGDDVQYNKQYVILNNINKTIIDMDTLNSLYFMSMCKKGGICANSTFSGWASKLNTNKDKIVIVPKQWININYEYEIPFDYTIAF